MTERSPPRLFVVASRPRSLAALAALTVVFGLAMLPAIVTMADHGATVIEWETAGSVERTQEVLDQWGSDGEAAAWWQLGLDVPFLIGYGLFLAGACTALARRAAEVGRPRLRRALAAGAWLGALAAAADLLQNVSLTLILSGHVAQPWARLSALTGPCITTLAAISAALAMVGLLATRRRTPVEAAAPGARE